VIVTFDESEGNARPERIYTVFLGDMIKPQEVTAAYNHYSVLRTIEDNFGIQPLHKNSGGGTASIIGHLEVVSCKLANNSPFRKHLLTL
jgi:hypothetical protein